MSFEHQYYLFVYIKVQLFYIKNLINYYHFRFTKVCYNFLFLNQYLIFYSMYNNVKLLFIFHINYLDLLYFPTFLVKYLQF